MTLATRPEAAKLAYTDEANASKVHIVDLSVGSLNDVASAGALEVSFPVKHLAFSLDGTLLLTAGSSTVTLWKWEEGVAVQHDAVDADETGVGAAFCAGLETPTFVVVGPTAARFVQLASSNVAPKLKTARVNFPAPLGAAEAITSFCWTRRGLWLGLGGGKVLGLARLEGPTSMAAVHAVSLEDRLGDNAVITQLEGGLDGGCLVAINHGARCYWVSGDGKVTAEATVGDDVCSLAMPPGAAANSKKLFIIATLRTPGSFARLPAWPAANKADLTGDVVRFQSSAGTAATVDITRSAVTLNQVPKLVEVQTLFNRVPSLKQIDKVPSLKELNARVTMAPPTATAILPQLVVPAPPHPAPAVAALTGVDADGNPAPCPGKVCANCRTQKTPLWRNGPLGPKTLCNACGVRYKLGKLPPPGGFPPGHVPPPAPPRKRPALLTSNGNPLKRQKGDKKAKVGAEGGAKKKRRPNGGGNEREGFLPSGKGGVLTDYDGAVLLMVLAGLYSH